MMATAGRTTVVQAEKIVKAGRIDPDHIHTPGIFVQRMIELANPVKRIEQRTTRPKPMN
jgi:3-oxoacid CoA-transferase subunit A